MFSMSVNILLLLVKRRKKEVNRAGCCEGPGLPHRTEEGAEFTAAMPPGRAPTPRGAQLRDSP